MKKIEDYLHLYLNEDNPIDAAICKNINPNLQRRIQLSGWNLYANDWEDEFIKPILRPLSDMTEEEKKAVNKFSINMPDGNDACKIFGSVTVYLLSKHFDLFGLIESGLAIDKTKLLNK